MKRKRILAVASGGGHWMQLMRLKPSLEGCEVTYVSNHGGYQGDVAGHKFHVVADASMWNKLRLIQLALQVAWIVVRVRPDVIITTGAAPGFFALFFGRLLRSRTVWVDSIANAEELSLSGRKAGRYADLWMTQWPEVAETTGAEYAGSVL